VLLREVQQPPGSPKVGVTRGGERHLHGLRQHQIGGLLATAATAPTLSPTCCWRSSTRCTCSALHEPAALPQEPTRCSASPRGGGEGATGSLAVQRGRGVRSSSGQARPGRRAAGGCSGCVEVGGLRQGGLHPHRYLHTSPSCWSWPARRGGRRTAAGWGRPSGPPRAWPALFLI